MKKLSSWLEDLIGDVVREELKHREHPPDQTADLVRLILDLHDKKWSYQTDSFLRTLNIDPSKYWEKYKAKPKREEPDHE